jgi:hypothetical protein
MINIISRQALLPPAAPVRGPGKVLRNLTKGLDRIGYPYVVNKHLRASRRVWVQDWPEALPAAARRGAFTVAGPNLWVLPNDVPAGYDLGGMLYLQPSDWVVRLWEQQGFHACPLRAWPVGVDTELFSPAASARQGDFVLVYHKHRDSLELTPILRTLHQRGLDFRLLIYSEYTEETYRDLLSRCSFVVWHGAHESQGLALEEALACDVPVLLCDIRRLSDAAGQSLRFDRALTTEVTAAPYFDARCGLRIASLEGLGQAVEAMADTWREFHPREYVLEHLSLEGQAEQFARLWEHWGLTFEKGIEERCETGRPFAPPVGPRLKESIRRRTIGLSARIAF